MNKTRLFNSILLSCVLIYSLLLSSAGADITTSKHNLSATGPGLIKAVSETRICIFCHTPHNGSPQTPLWNKEPGPLNYMLYQSTTLLTVPSQPSGSSRLCLTCHDGLIALGALLTGEVDMSGDQTLSSGRSHIGDDLADDHPVSISYLDAMFANTEIVSPVPDHPKMIFYDPVNLKIECSTCHDAHNDTLCSRGSDCKFLIMDNQYSQLCLMCHNMNGWVNSTEFISLEIWNGIPPDPWPYTDWNTVSENACQNCHMPHSAGRSDWLLYYVAEESNCFSCHNGNVASQDVEADFDKSSRHPVGSTTKIHDPGENAMTSGHVECQDCHNPHAYNNNPADAPDVSGMIGMVDGVDRFGISKYAEDGTPALYEYEICFRCHAETSSGVSYVPRVLDETNTRLEFSLTNPSYHPVEGMGQNDDVPSLESPLTTSSIIYCMDCHDSDDSPEVDGNGPKGVHGSDFSPILREQYETDYVVESEERYALCYRCHERESILADVSFKQNISFKGGHSGHLENVLYPSPCSVCHDPHGVQSNPATGSHDHLINFDTRIVSERSGESYPFFTDLGDESGSCTLICHGVDHTGAAGGYDY